MSERWDGFGDRIKRLNPIWMMGRGMNVGQMTEYVQMIGLALLLEVFYRELDNNPQRTRDDLVDIVGAIAHDMGIEASDQALLERMVDGYLWYKDAELQQPYAGTFYDERKGGLDSQMFRYMKEDRHHSQWDKGGKTVYQLTEEALEIIFMSRELLQELEISIDQMYIQQQMKRGNYRKALRGLDDLLARVRRLIRQEEEYHDDIRRNPKLIFRQGASLRSKREEEIRGQFEEEKRRFDELLYTLQRLSAASSEEFGRLQEKIESTRQVHDRLAQIVLGNMSLELELRVKFPHLFWIQSTVSFRRSYWEEWVLKDGLPEADNMEALLVPLFSPQPEFLYPLDWAWEEQDLSLEARHREEELVIEKEEESRSPERVIDWGDIVSLWLPIMEQLIEHGAASLSAMRGISLEQQRHWLRQKEAVDLWLMFYGSELVIPKLESESVYSDERLVLLQKCAEQDRRIHRLEGNIIAASIESEQSMIRWEGAVITPFVLHCKESEHE